MLMVVTVVMLLFNEAPRVWAEKYKFRAQNTDETTTVATSQWAGGQMELY